MAGSKVQTNKSGGTDLLQPRKLAEPFRSSWYLSNHRRTEEREVLVRTILPTWLLLTAKRVGGLGPRPIRALCRA